MVLTPPTPLLLDDAQNLYEEAAEVSQTVQRLTLRKRTTSPYQIKLPYMTDRLRVKKGTPTSPPEMQQPAPEAVATLRRTDVQVVSDSNCATSQSGSGMPIRTGHRSAFLSVRLPQGTLVDPAGNPDPKVVSNSAVGSSPGPIARPPTAEIPPVYIAAPTILSSLDTWGEINEELCREMEVFAVLSAVAPSHFFASEEVLRIPGPVLPRATRTSSARAARGPWLGGPEGGPTRWAGPWSSFVFPVVVA
ncbi:hypothetical protein C8Q79DRAFT_1015074 [Trametes meyenii]|nr:hypothetical protein C8Q79DRAFT_1015074 [Trametes meyenii]